MSEFVFEDLKQVHAHWTCNGTMRISDPTYEKGMENGSFRIAVKFSVVPGKWNVYFNIGKEGISNDRVYWVWTTHQNRPPKDIDNFEEDGYLCVDTGMMVFLDDDYYPAKGNEKANDSFFNLCSETTYKHYMCYIQDNEETKYVGLVTKSGFGDGSYFC